MDRNHTPDAASSKRDKTRHDAGPEEALPARKTSTARASGFVAFTPMSQSTAMRTISSFRIYSACRCSATTRRRCPPSSAFRPSSTRRGRSAEAARTFGSAVLSATVWRDGLRSEIRVRLAETQRRNEVGAVTAAIAAACGAVRRRSDWLLFGTSARRPGLIGRTAGAISTGRRLSLSLGSDFGRSPRRRAFRPGVQPNRAARRPPRHAVRSRGHRLGDDVHRAVGRGLNAGRAARPDPSSAKVIVSHPRPALSRPTRAIRPLKFRPSRAIPPRRRQPRPVAARNGPTRGPRSASDSEALPRF